MADREKVIEALRICRENLSTKSCRKCPYMRGRDGNGTCYPEDAKENGLSLCWQDLVDDAVSLLKEQNEGIEPEISRKSVTETTVSLWYKCGACGGEIEQGDDEFCRHCGKKVKWDD